MLFLETSRDMANVLITGANRGLGLAFARAYLKRGDTVYGTTREPSLATDLQDAGANVEELDVTDDASIQLLSERLAGVPLDLVILNAGILRRDSVDSADASVMLRQFDTNALGALRTALGMRSNLALAEAPKLVAITSRMGSIADNTSGGFYGYRASKAALNAIMKGLSIDFEPWPVALIHPGYVRTRLTNNQGDLTPEEAVERMVSVIDRLDAHGTGRFFHRDGHELPW